MEKKIKLLSPNQLNEIETLYFLKDYFLKKGFTPVSKKKFYTSFIKKIKRTIIFFKKIKIDFNNPEKKDVVIYDANMEKNLFYQLELETL